MRAVMADNDISGYLDIILLVCRSATWREIWENLGLHVVTFEELGLPRNSSDVELWQACQRHETVLVTANRRHKSEDSLEEAIRTLNTLIYLTINLKALQRAKEINASVLRFPLSPTG